MPTPAPIVKIIWARSAGLCAYPGCRRDVARDERGGKALTPAEVAHIVSESPSGPRGQYAAPGGSTAAAANYLLLCLEHHNEIDTVPDRYSVEKLVMMKADHERWVTQTLGADAATLPEPAYCDELLHSSLLPATLLPPVVFAAPCLKSEAAVRQALVYPPASELAFPFVVRGGDILTFCDLTDHDSPFAPIIDATKVGRHRVTDWYAVPDKMRWYVDLLNRALNKLTGRRGLHFDKEHHRYYFPLGPDGGDRSADYLTLMGRRSSRNVAWRPHFRHNGEAKRHCEHLTVSVIDAATNESLFDRSLEPSVGEVVARSILMGRRRFMYPQAEAAAEKALVASAAWRKSIASDIEEGCLRSAQGSSYLDRVRAEAYALLRVHPAFAARELPQETTLG